MAYVKAIPAPVGGWNTRDALADMPEDTASILDNWFPNEGRVDTRPGYSEYATGLGGQVETLAELITASSRKFVAAANNNLWDISSSGAGSSLASGFTNDRWSTANMNGKIAFVNGDDTPQQYDGSTVSTLTVTGPTAANLIGVHVFNGRSYFWEDDSQSFWYSAVNTLGGTVTEFNLSRIGNFGGRLLAMGTWTHDSGAGADDFAVFFMESGDTLVYQGSDPASFSLVGVFRLAPLISQRSIIKAGGDLIAVTRDGFVSLKGAITQGRLTDRGIISDQINPAVTEAATDFGGNWGWEAFHYPGGNMLMFNVPRNTNSIYDQYVFNTNTGSPCRFRDIPANTWGIYNDKAYFGGNQKVYLFDDTREDDGAIISCDALTAPTWLGSRAYQKHLTAVQAVTASDTTVPSSLKVAADFAVPNVSYNSTTYPLSGAAWDTAVWDVDNWAGSGFKTTTEWLNTRAYGYNFRTRFKVRGNNQLTKWYSINYMFNKGGLV